MSAIDPQPVRAGRPKLLAAIVLLATLVAGVLLGIVADRAFLRRGPHRMPPRAADFLVSRLDEKLDLSTQQEQQIREIIKKRHSRMEVMWSDAHREIEQANREIESVLTPEQRPEFQKLRMRMMSRRHRR